MKLNKGKKTEVLSNNQDQDSMNFGIGDVSTIIEILRNRLYSNPIQTLTQEYLSNGRDATREAGSKKSLKVTLPTGLDSVLKIRDYGVGLSPDRVKDVFVLYGASTKRTDNTQTGGFGIGAKSAWAYTDSFTIVSYYNKKEYVYIAHTGKNSNGTLEKISETATTEPNGVEIQIPVKPEHRQQFIDAVYRSTLFWKERPEFAGITDHEVKEEYKNFHSKVLHQKDHWKVVEGSDFYKQLLGFNSYSSQTDLILSVDGIPYPLTKFYYNPNVQKLREAFLGRSGNGGSFMILEVKTGDIEVSATREAVSDREENVNEILSIIEKTVTSLKEYIQTQIDSKHDSLFKYMVTYIRLRQSFHATLLPTFNFKMDDVEYKQSQYGALEQRAYEVKSERFAMRRQRGDRQVMNSDVTAINIVTPKMKFVIRDNDDSENKAKKKIKKLLEDNKGTVDHVYLLSDYPVEKMELIAKHFECLKLSALSFDKEQKNTKKRPEDKITVRVISIQGTNLWNQGIDVKTQNDLTFDQLNANDAKYILIPFSSEDKFKNNNHRFVAMVKFLTKVGGYSVVKLSNRDYRLAKENLDTAYEYNEIENKISDFVTIPKDSWDKIEESMKFNSSMANLNVLVNTIKDQEFASFLRATTTAHNNRNNEGNSIAPEILVQYPRFVQLKAEMEEKQKQEQVFFSRYKFLRRLDLRQLDYSEKEEIVEFINWKWDKMNPKVEEPKAAKKPKKKS